MGVLDRPSLELLIFGERGARRFTQDSPVLPDVWLRYGQAPRDEPGDLLLTPFREATVASLGRELMDRLAREREMRPGEPRFSAGLAMNQSTVVVRLTFAQLMRVALPLSAWWRAHVLGGDAGAPPPDLGSAESRQRLLEGLERMEAARQARRSVERAPREPGVHVWYEDEELLWMVRLVGAMGAFWDEGAPDQVHRPSPLDITERHHALVQSFCDLMADVEPPPPHGPSQLFLVSVNREATPALTRSVLAVKADAARLLFHVSSARLTWAIIDSGIDATHPAFRERGDNGESYPEPFNPPVPGRRQGKVPAPWTNHSRVRRTYDFTRVRLIMNPMDDAQDQLDELLREQGGAESPTDSARLQSQIDFWTSVVNDPDAMEKAKRLREGLKSGRTLDWAEMLPLLEVPHDDTYVERRHDHGTHVAGILAADWRPEDHCDPTRRTDERLEGICPDINLMDLRALDDFGRGDEFSVMAALQFVRWLNANQDSPVVHGVNLSLSIPHDVANYACGRTPVCDECERVVASGVVVVAAAGNEGYLQFETPTGQAEGYRSISITDPGNAEAVITVGATHRYHPHTYGVSYFSSRGPTGDGRVKPDLVAPGEKILAPVPRGVQVMDGTSMAAPHVSGAAALLMSRHLELIGHPTLVKQTLCETATDLGRERYFQGAGMLDALRALQHV